MLRRCICSLRASALSCFQPAQKSLYTHIGGAPQLPYSRLGDLQHRVSQISQSSSVQVCLRSMGRKAAGATSAAAQGAQTPRRRKTKEPETDEGSPSEAPAEIAASAGPENDDGSPPAKRAKPARSKKAAATKDAKAENGEAEGEGAAEAAAPAAKPKRSKAVKWPPGPLYTSSMRPSKFEGPAHRFISWNVAGFRALMKKDADALKKLIAEENVDAICIQEHKLQDDHIADVIKAAGLEGWEAVWSHATQKGYSGTAIFCRERPLTTRIGIGHVDHDDEGRVITVELPDLWLVNVYVPNSGEGLKRLDYRTQKWDQAFADYIKELQSSKPVVVAGDFNCAHKEIDIHNPKGNLRSAGFTQEERDSFSAGLLGEVGLVDSWRRQHPDVVGYTYYSYRFKMREKGKGWRLDYFLVSPALAESVHDSYILPDVTGSDHVPLGIIIKKQQQ